MKIRLLIAAMFLIAVSVALAPTASAEPCIENQAGTNLGKCGGCTGWSHDGVVTCTGSSAEGYGYCNGGGIYAWLCWKI